jgi:alpha-tubulin suppressor-like RCC1 family protein
LQFSSPPENNEVFACGNNERGQLGLGDYINRNNPTKLDFSHELYFKEEKLIKNAYKS